MSHPPAGADVGAGLARFLSDHFGERFTVGDVAASSAGARRSNLLLDAESPSRRLRLEATIMPTAAIEVNPMTAEAGVRALAERYGVPVPHVHAVCTDPGYVGGPFFLSDRVEGESVPRRVLRLVHAGGLGERVAGQLGEALGRLHGIDPAEAPDDLVDDPSRNPAEAALAGAERMVADLRLPRPALALGLRWLERHLPPAPPRRTVLHGDARNGNLLVSARGLEAILDWELAVRHGDPMQDLAWPALRTWRFREDGREVGGLGGRQPYASGYERGGGSFDAERFHWWKVMSTLRWALGLAGQSAAHLDGSFRSIVMAASGRRVPELEWDLLMLVRPSSQPFLLSPSAGRRRRPGPARGTRPAGRRS